MTSQGRHDFEGAYRDGSAPWDIGKPQPEVIRLEEEGAFRGTVLDAGCGTGENTLLLAARGHPVMGIDGSSTAIARARQKAVGRGLSVPFQVVDALRLEDLKQRFDTVLDCGLFHVFDDEERRRYAEGLAVAVGSGGQVQLLCFSDEEPPGPGPRRVSEWDIRSTFRGAFVLTSIRPAVLSSLVHPGGARAWAATLTRL
jgi:SAM-dependent methyltransferase